VQTGTRLALHAGWQLAEQVHVRGQLCAARVSARNTCRQAVRQHACLRKAAGTGLRRSSTASGTSRTSSMPMNGKAACAACCSVLRRSDGAARNAYAPPAA
jgi:hypothetical protein